MNCGSQTLYNRKILQLHFVPLILIYKLVVFKSVSHIQLRFSCFEMHTLCKQSVSVNVERFEIVPFGSLAFHTELRDFEVDLKNVIDSNLYRIYFQ